MSHPLLPDHFHPIDLLFAERICPEATPEGAQFLAYLLQQAREGHLCVDLSCIDDPLLIKGESELPPILFKKFLVKEGSKVYLKKNWECENTFITHLKRLKSYLPYPEISLSGLDELPLNNEQKGAIVKAAGQCLTLITGGPGTGKTYTAAHLIKLFQQSGLKNIVVAAPTGKAAANIRSALGVAAESCTVQTLHSLLKREYLYADLVLVDEASMIDAALMTRLFKSVKEGARVILLGDKHQLPPIEIGNFFADLAEDITLVAELKNCLRIELQEIIYLSECVKKGETIAWDPLPEVHRLINSIIETKIPVLTPLRKGIYGVEHLNRLIYQRYHSLGEHRIPIMITANDLATELYNGDTGIWHQEKKIALFKGREIPASLLPPFEYAYVLSVHKSQGSEYENAMLLLPQGAEQFGREMLYTAITRVKKEIKILAHEGVVEHIVKNHYRRLSGIRNL